MQNTIFTITAVFLFAGWLALEIALHRRVLRGTVVGIRAPRLPLAELIVSDLIVRLDDGREVDAQASGCVQCQARFAAGSRVALLRRGDGYIVTVPWLRQRAKTCGAGE
jgi:hypothetical protein